MIQLLKNVAKQLLPNAVSDYSIRRHEYMRCGFPPTQASRLAFSTRRYQAFGDSRLNLFPQEITRSLRTCIDAGAHEGSWTEALLEFFHPECVLLLECEPRLVGRLQKKFSSTPSVRVIDAALADVQGVGTFYQLRHPASSSLLQPRIETAREYQEKSWDVIGEVRVNKVTYDEVVSDQSEISILKLDIQGAERGVLANSSAGLAKTKSVLLEVNFTAHYSDDAVFPELHSLMMEKGFGLYRLSSVYHRGGRALFADAVYVRETILSALQRSG